MNKINGNREGVDITALSPTSPIGKWVYGGGALIFMVGVLGVLAGYAINNVSDKG